MATSGDAFRIAIGQASAKRCLPIQINNATETTMDDPEIPSGNSRKKGKEENKKDGEYVVGIDIASRNLGICLLDTDENKVSAFIHIDLAGKKRTIPTAAVCAELIKTTILESELLCKNITCAIIEKQAHVNNKNVAIENALADVYQSIGARVIVISPQNVNKEIIETCCPCIREARNIATWLENNTGTTNSLKSKRYSKKKKLFAIIGERLLSRTERLMIERIKGHRIKLQKEFVQHDNRYKRKRNMRKSTRKVKRNFEYDLYDAFLTALVGIKQIGEKENNHDRDFLQERLSKFSHIS